MHETNLQRKCLSKPEPQQTLSQQVECNSTQPTSLSIGKSPSEGPPHADLSILQVL